MVWKLHNLNPNWFVCRSRLCERTTYDNTSSSVRENCYHTSLFLLGLHKRGGWTIFLHMNTVQMIFKMYTLQNAKYRTNVTFLKITAHIVSFRHLPCTAVVTTIQAVWSVSLPWCDRVHTMWHTVGMSAPRSRLHVVWDWKWQRCHPLGTEITYPQRRHASYRNKQCRAPSDRGVPCRIECRRFVYLIGSQALSTNRHLRVAWLCGCVGFVWGLVWGLVWMSAWAWVGCSVTTRGYGCPLTDVTWCRRRGSTVIRKGIGDAGACKQQRCCVCWWRGSGDNTPHCACDHHALEQWSGQHQSNRCDRGKVRCTERAVPHRRRTVVWEGTLPFTITLLACMTLYSEAINVLSRQTLERQARCATCFLWLRSVYNHQLSLSTCCAKTSVIPIPWRRSGGTLLGTCVVPRRCLWMWSNSTWTWPRSLATSSEHRRGCVNPTLLQLTSAWSDHVTCRINDTSGFSREQCLYSASTFMQRQNHITPHVLQECHECKLYDCRRFTTAFSKNEQFHFCIRFDLRIFLMMFPSESAKRGAHTYCTITSSDRCHGWWVASVGVWQILRPYRTDLTRCLLWVCSTHAARFRAC